MRTRVFQNVSRLAFGLFVVTALLGATGMVALAESGQQPRALTDSAPVGGTFVGDAAGRFVYYAIAYPGNSLDLRIQVGFAADSNLFGKGLGFKVYGPNGFEGQGTLQDGGYLELSYNESDPASLLVQLYNYYDGLNVPYSVTAEGLPAVAQSVEEPAAAPATTAAASDTSPASDMSGAVAGSNAGAFGMHTIASTGDETDITVEMTFTPDDPVVAHAVGFRVYDPDGNQVALGTVTDTPGVRQATFSSAKVGNYMVQVYNYADGVTLYYALTVSR